MAKGSGKLIDTDAIVLIGIIAGAIIYRDEILDFFMNLGKDYGIGSCPDGQHKNDAGVCVDDSNGGGNGGGGGTGCTTSFGNGAVSLHGLQSGGQQWRKEWDLKKRYLNCSFKAYFLIPSGPSDETISIKLRGGPHTGSGDNATTRMGCCYIMCLPFGGGSKNNFQKECPHPDYDKMTMPTDFNPGSILKKWTGFRADLMNVGNGVKITTYIDTSGLVNNQPQNKWRKWYSITDTGQYGHGSATKPPFNKSPVNGNNPQVIVRIDGDTKSQVTGYQMKFASICEVKA